MAVVLQFPVKKFIVNVYEEVRKKQNDIYRKKIDFLLKEAYRNFLEGYLTRVSKNGTVDFPAFMYLSGKVICQEALNQAQEVVLSRIKAKKINADYTRRIKELRK